MCKLKLGLCRLHDRRTLCHLGAQRSPVDQMVFARGPLRRRSRQPRMHETNVTCSPTHTRQLGILGSSMLSPRAKDEMIGIAPSESSLSASRDGWSSAPPMCRTAVRPVCKMLGLSLGISMPLSTMVPLVWQETADLRRTQGTRCERSEAPREASAREGSRSRSDLYRVALRLLCMTSRLG